MICTDVTLIGTKRSPSALVHEENALLMKMDKNEAVFA